MSISNYYSPMLSSSWLFSNVILNNSPMLSNGHLQLLFCNVIVLLVVLNCYSKIFPNAIQCPSPIVILQCYPPLGCLAASESLLLSRSLTTFALPLHHLLVQTNIMETGDKTQTHKYNSMQDQVNKKYPDFPTKIIWSRIKVWFWSPAGKWEASIMICCKIKGYKNLGNNLVI